MAQRRFFALLLTAVMLLACVPAAAAETSGESSASAQSSGMLVEKRRVYGGSFGDVPAGYWCESAVATCYETGLLSGYRADAFGPKNPLTNAQIAAVCARLYSLLTGGDGQIPLIYDDAPWYAGYYAYLDGALGTDYALRTQTPAESCRRATFAAALWAVLTAAGVSLPVINNVTAVPDVNALYGGAGTLALYRAGVLTGGDAYGTFGGSGTLNRGQAAAMLARLTDPAQRMRVALKSFDLCADVLGAAPDTVLATVNGDPVTAEQLAPQLVTSLLQWGANATASACTDALRLYKTYVSAPLTLAASLGIALTDDARAAARANAETERGYLGYGVQYYEREQTAAALKAEMETYYLLHDASDGKTAASTYQRALSATAEGLRAEAAPALTALDLSAVRARALATPLSGWLFS